MKSNRRYQRLTEIIRACALRIDLNFEMGLSKLPAVITSLDSTLYLSSNAWRNRCEEIGVYHQECTARLIIGIIRTVTEAYESHRLLADLRRQNGMVKTRLFIHLHPSYSSNRNYQQWRFAKITVDFHLLCTNYM